MKPEFKFSFTQLAIDLTNNNLADYSAQGFDRKGTEDMLRSEILEAIGVEKLTPRLYEKHKNDIFEIIEETISPIINDRLEEQMGQFAEVRNVDWGDSLEFDVENPELFEVALIADGTANLRRQRIDQGKVSVNVETLGIKVYDEFYRFVSGRVNWTRVIDKVVKSYEREVAVRVNSAITGGYNAIDPVFKYTGTYNEDQIVRVAQAVEALYGEAVIIGTKQALSPLKPSYAGDAVKDNFNALGHVGIYNGFRTVLLAQSFKPGTYDFNLSDKDLLVLPTSGDKFVKIITEGTAFIRDFSNDQGDQSFEHVFTQKIGVAVPHAKEYGMIRLS